MKILFLILFLFLSCNKNPSNPDEGDNDNNLCTEQNANLECNDGSLVCDLEECTDVPNPDEGDNDNNLCTEQNANLECSDGSLVCDLEECTDVPNNIPNWDCNDNGFLDNYNDYQNNGSITAAILVDGNNLVSPGDLFAAFVDGEQRGAGDLTEVPFGPYAGTFQFLTLIYSNAASGETITYKYYDFETDTVYDLIETTPWVSDMMLGDVLDPEILNTSGATSECYNDCDGTEHGNCSSSNNDSASDCVDDHIATANLGGCTGAVEALGCDFVFDGSLISELCPVTCNVCP